MTHTHALSSSTHSRSASSLFTIHAVCTGSVKSCQEETELPIYNGNYYRVITYVVRISENLTLLNITAGHGSYCPSASLFLKDYRRTERESESILSLSAMAFV